MLAQGAAAGFAGCGAVGRVVLSWQARKSGASVQGSGHNSVVLEYAEEEAVDCGCGIAEDSHFDVAEVVADADGGHGLAGAHGCSLGSVDVSDLVPARRCSRNSFGDDRAHLPRWVDRLRRQLAAEVSGRTRQGVVCIR